MQKFNKSGEISKGLYFVFSLLLFYHFFLSLAEGYRKGFVSNNFDSQILLWPLMVIAIFAVLTSSSSHQE